MANMFFSNHCLHALNHFIMYMLHLPQMFNSLCTQFAKDETLFDKPAFILLIQPPHEHTRNSGAAIPHFLCQTTEESYNIRIVFQKGILYYVTFTLGD